MFDGDTLTFEAEDDLRKPIPAGTTAKVQVRRTKEGNLPRTQEDFRHGTNDYGPWMIVPFEVTEGEFKGEWASMILNVDTKRRDFRAVVESVTGIDLKSGNQQLSFQDFVDKLVSGIFEAELGPEKRKNRSTGELEATGYNKCFELKARVGDREIGGEDGAATTSEVPNIGEEDVDPDDVPF